MTQIAKDGSHTSRAAKGFSIIELLIIVCLVMILAAIGIPATRSAIATYQLDAAVDSVTGAIQSTRYQAIMHGYLYQVDFNSTNNQIQVSSEVPPATAFSTVGAAVPISAAAVTLGVGSPSSGSTGHATLQFKANGLVSITSGQAAPLSLTLTYHGATKTITVSNYGSITVQ